MENVKFMCSALPTVNGHTMQGLEPDANGFYPVVLGAMGMPTRADVWYDEPSWIAAMENPKTRFNICLRDGNLMGCWGHPVVRGKEDIPKLLAIDESKVSHVFGKVWVDSTPTPVNGYNAYLIRALVKPFGPYGPVLEKSLRDPMINTSFSVRSLCLPWTGPDKRFEYRKVQLVVTFDAVAAPGFEVATKRYVAGTESFEIPVGRQDLEQAVASHTGMESGFMLTDRDLLRIFRDETYTLNGQKIATAIAGQKSLVGSDGNLRSAASLCYGGR